MKLLLHIQGQSLIHLQPKVSAGVISYCCKLRIKRCRSTFSWTENDTHVTLVTTFRDHLVSKLMKDVEGTCSGRHGFAVAITGAESIGKGLIRNGTVLVTFPMRCQCIVFRPFKGEILGAGVTMVNKLIPDDMELQTGDLPSYTTSDGSVKIQKDCELWLKIIGTQVDVTEITKAQKIRNCSLRSKQLQLQSNQFCAQLISCQEKAWREVEKQRADKHPVEAL